MMKMAFRWFGASDPVVLAHIRQIPGVRSVVSALYDLPVGEVWTRSPVAALQDEVARADLRLAVIESIPVHEDIKLGRGERTDDAESGGRDPVAVLFHA